MLNRNSREELSVHNRTPNESDKIHRYKPGAGFASPVNPSTAVSFGIGRIGRIGMDRKDRRDGKDGKESPASGSLDIAGDPLAGGSCL